MIDQFKGDISFQTRITAAAMATAVGVLMIACAMFMLEQWGAGRANLIQTQKQVAAVLAPHLAEAMTHGDKPRLSRILQNVAIAPRLVDATLTDDKGRVFARYENEAHDKAIQGQLLQSSTPLTFDGRPRGVLYIRSHLESMGQILPRYLALTGALFFMATALSLFLGRLLAKQVIEPVGRLSRAMGELAISGDLRQRVERLENDEFGQLIESFNALLDRLQVNDKELRATMTALESARDDAQAANVQKSQFLANMSHEIRTPLNGVLAMAQVMSIDDLDGKQRERLDVIRDSGEALLTILNDILDVSKIEAGKLELEIIEFDFEGLVNATADGFRPIAENKGLDFALDVGVAARGARLGDPARLRQILANLISNAVKFTNEGGVKISVVGLGEDGEEGLRIEVCDTGIGIADDKLSLLFQKFTQLDASTTRHFGGTGLGLSICRELTTMMGGRIWVENGADAGAAFFVELPLAKASASTEPTVVAVEQPQEQGEPLRILAAEDNATNQLVLKTIIEIFGAELQIVENGRLALEAWAASTPDIILMDIQMPEMDGITATRLIRQAEAASGRRRTPILALSANAMAHQVKEYMAAGMDGHVAKPIELNKLHAALETSLNPSQALDQAAASF